jgi:hypothetical protein
MAKQSSRFALVFQCLAWQPFVSPRERQPHKGRVHVSRRLFKFSSIEFFARLGCSRAREGGTYD